MKEYSSILGPNGNFNMPCIAFYKYDGSNIRAEWNPKQGWSKFGTRTRLVDQSDPTFGPAIPLFKETLADGIEKVLRDSKEWRNSQRVTVFCEFFGPTSFAGVHDLSLPNDPKQLILFDVNIHKKGLIDPRTFVRKFGHLNSARVVYEGNYNQQFITDVKNGIFDLNEGVVAKGGSGHNLWMRKVKTNVYIQKLKDVFQEKWQQYGE